MRRVTVSGRRILPITAHQLPFTRVVAGRLRQWTPSRVLFARGEGLIRVARVCGPDPNLGRRHYVTRTLRGDRADALRELAEHANLASAVGTHISRSLSSSISGSPGMDGADRSLRVRNLGSIIERQLKPGRGDDLSEWDLTGAIVDQFYEHLRTGEVSTATQ
jgi:hypothetical protein